MHGSWKRENFPHLDRGNSRITSPCHKRYNCIAWAVGVNTKWLWPSLTPSAKWIHWPDGAPGEITIEAFVKAFESYGYTKCENSDLEAHYQKIALYAIKEPDGTEKPTHAARQLENGLWTSKIGRLEDIEHNELDDVSGPLYGRPVLFMKKR